VADLEELLASLGEEVAVDIDYDAPEPGQFPPQVPIGDHEFVFHLPENGEDRFSSVAIQGANYFSVTTELEIALPDKDTPAMIRYQRVNDFKTGKMLNSSIGDLVRCLDLHPEQDGRRGIANALIGADGRARGIAQIGWERYCKSCQQIVSTAPRKRKAPKKSDAPWPRGTDKQPLLIVACPSCGDKGYGREVVVNWRLPKKG
jgi:hypothetical protein